MTWDDMRSIYLSRFAIVWLLEKPIDAQMPNVLTHFFSNGFFSFYEIWSYETDASFLYGFSLKTVYRAGINNKIIYLTSEFEHRSVQSNEVEYKSKAMRVEPRHFSTVFLWSHIIHRFHVSS